MRRSSLLDLEVRRLVPRRPLDVAPEAGLLLTRDWVAFEGGVDGGAEVLAGDGGVIVELRTRGSEPGPTTLPLWSLSCPSGCTKRGDAVSKHPQSFDALTGHPGPTYLSPPERQR